MAPALRLNNGHDAVDAELEVALGIELVDRMQLFGKVEQAFLVANDADLDDTQHLTQLHKPRRLESIDERRVSGEGRGGPSGSQLGGAGQDEVKGFRLVLAQLVAQEGETMHRVAFAAAEYGAELVASFLIESFEFCKPAHLISWKWPCRGIQKCN